MIGRFSSPCTIYLRCMITNVTRWHKVIKKQLYIDPPNKMTKTDFE